MRRYKCVAYPQLPHGFHRILLLSLCHCTALPAVYVALSLLRQLRDCCAVVGMKSESLHSRTILFR